MTVIRYVTSLTVMFAASCVRTGFPLSVASDKFTNQIIMPHQSQGKLLINIMFP